MGWAKDVTQIPHKYCLLQDWCQNYWTSFACQNCGMPWHPLNTTSVGLSMICACHATCALLEAELNKFYEGRAWVRRSSQNRWASRRKRGMGCPVLVSWIYFAIDLLNHAVQWWQFWGSRGRKDMEGQTFDRYHTPKMNIRWFQRLCPTDTQEISRVCLCPGCWFCWCCCGGWWHGTEIRTEVLRLCIHQVRMP